MLGEKNPIKSKCELVTQRHGQVSLLDTGKIKIRLDVMGREWGDGVANVNYTNCQVLCVLGFLMWLPYL